MLFQYSDGTDVFVALSETELLMLMRQIYSFVNFDFFKWLYLAHYLVYLHQTWGFCETRCALLHYVDQ